MATPTPTPIMYIAKSTVQCNQLGPDQADCLYKSIDGKDYNACLCGSHGQACADVPKSQEKAYPIDPANLQCQFTAR